MRDDLRERRRKTFQLWWVEGRPRHEVCERLADEYDVQPNTIDRDMERVDTWLPKLDQRPSEARLWVKTMRQNIRERQRELRAAKQDADMGPHDMLPLRDALDKAIKRLLEVEQSIGDVDMAPKPIEVRGDPANPVQHAHGDRNTHAHGDTDAHAHGDTHAHADRNTHAHTRG